MCILHGGKCMKMKNKEEVLETEKPNHLQCQHEEADTLLVFHINSISSHIMFLQERKAEALSAVGGRFKTYHGTAIHHH